MKIALVSKLWEETSPTSDGGTGMVVGNLAEALARKGHEVTVFGVGCSKIAVKVNAVAETPFHSYEESIHYWNIENAFRLHDQFDIINCWVDQSAVYFSDFVATPSVHTIDYGDLSQPAVRMLKAHKHLNFVAISKVMKELIPGLNWIDTIYNGTETRNFPFQSEVDDYLLFVGRMSATKGPDKAIQAALQLKQKLILVAKTRPEYDGHFLKQEIFPFIDGRHIIHHETVDFNTRVLLYQHAFVLINPISYLEAFGLTMTEAMSCGTPVIAFDQGAVPEVVKDGETGFIVNFSEKKKRGNWIVKKSGVEGLVEAIKRLRSLSRNEYRAMRLACRKRVETHFSVAKMAENYEIIYKRLKKTH